jgi:hypothetical protein
MKNVTHYMFLSRLDRSDWTMIPVCPTPCPLLSLRFAHKGWPSMEETADPISENRLILYSLIHSFILSSIHSFIHSFVHSFIHSFIHSTGCLAGSLID